MEADADFVESAAEVAVTVARAGFGIVAGAVYKPVEEIEPQEPATQPIPETAHVTLVFVLPFTVATNCCWPLTESVTSSGDRATDTLAAEPPVRHAFAVRCGFGHGHASVTGVCSGLPF